MILRHGNEEKRPFRHGNQPIGRNGNRRWNVICEEQEGQFDWTIECVKGSKI